jgi:hypothetical protein
MEVMARERPEVAFEVVGHRHRGLKRVRVEVAEADLPFDHGAKQCVLDRVVAVAEVGVDGLLGHSGLDGDVLDRGCSEPALEEEAVGRCEDVVSLRA